MPSRLNAPVLTLDAAKMHQIDPRNVESLFGMWTVFSKCSHSIKDGSRLENLSWRVWARETLCCPPQPEKTIVPTIDISAGQSSQVPSLSNSIASDDSSSEEESPRSQPRRRQYSREDEQTALSKSRGNEPHLTPSTLEKIVVTIQEKPSLGPLSPSIEASLPPLSVADMDFPLRKLNNKDEQQEKDADRRELHNSTESCISGTTVNTTTTNFTRQSDHRNSDTSVSSDGLERTGSVVHGFSPVSNSLKSKPMQCSTLPSGKLAPAPIKKPGMFQLGASSEDDESSFDSKVASFRPVHRPSSLSQSLNKPIEQLKATERKHPSYRDIVEQRKEYSDPENDEGAIASSDDESAIDDEEEDDDMWEDSPSDDEKAPVPAQVQFKRVDSRKELVSRPSALSLGLQQGRRVSGLQNEASWSSPAFRRNRTSSLQGPSMPGSPDENEEDGLTMAKGPPKAPPQNAPAKTQPKPIIMTTSNGQSMALSPRSTRRNMLSTELTESLRKNLLWERQQKSQTANAFLKRSRNAQSMANLQGAAAGPSVAPLAAPEQQENHHSWNHDFDNPWEFNAKGW